MRTRRSYAAFLVAALAVGAMLMTRTRPAEAFSLGIVTEVHNAAHQDIGAGPVSGGTVVHDKAIITICDFGCANFPFGGTVTFRLYGNGTCTAPTIAADQTVTVTSAGGLVYTAESGPFTTPAGGGAFSYQATYNGFSDPSGANYAPQTAHCEPFTVAGTPPPPPPPPPPGGGQITGTNVDCADFKSGTTALSSLLYGLKDGKINTINPGGFFYWATITASSAGPLTIAVSQTTSFTPFVIQNTGSNFVLYNSSCTSVASLSASGTGGTLTTGTLPAGTYFLRVKYTTSDAAGPDGDAPPSGVGCQSAANSSAYSFSTTVNSVAGNSASTCLRPK